MKPEELTAWALNELSAAEASRVEASFAEEPQIAQQAVETRAFCNMLTEHLSVGDAAFTNEQRQALLAQVEQAPRPASNVLDMRQAVLQRVHQSPAPRPKFLRKPLVIGLSAAAACWAIVFSVQGPHESAVSQPQTAQQEQRQLSEQVLVQLAKADASSGSYDKAQQHLQQALAKRPNNTEARELMAKVDALKALHLKQAPLPAPSDSLVVVAQPNAKPKSPTTTAPAVVTQSAVVANQDVPTNASAATMLPQTTSGSSAKAKPDPRQMGGYNPNKIKRIEPLKENAPKATNEPVFHAPMALPPEQEKLKPVWHLGTGFIFD